MSADNVTCLRRLSTFLNVPLNDITLDLDRMPTASVSQETVTGFTNIVLRLLKKSKGCRLSEDAVERAQVMQWLEYCVLYALQDGGTLAVGQMLNELNGALEPRTYLVGHTITIADVALYYSLLNVMGKLSHLDKERYVNLSRWFDNVQRQAAVRSKRPLVDFSTTFLCDVSAR